MQTLVPLQKKDIIALIAPSGAVKDEKSLYNAVDFLQSKGYKVVLGKNVLAKEDYLAGNDDLRLEDLHWAFENPDVKAILCVRGGYGCARLLDKINYDLVVQNPKIFLGHSDITALLNNFSMPVFHSPMAIGDFAGDIDSFSEKSFFEVVSGIKPFYEFRAKNNFLTINSGVAQGKLIGGNLSVLVSLLGTKYAPDFVGKILLLEDLNEPLYKIDRMLTQLKLAGVFDNVAGVIVADFGETQVSDDFLRQFVVGKPSIYGFQASHAKDKYTLPMNVEYLLDSDKGVLQLREQIFQ